jgi:glycosyltransferase involved in cell wall biosynthesis
LAASEKLFNPIQAPGCGHKTLPQTYPNARIKVLYIISDLSIGGAEIMLYKLLKETDRDRFEPVVMSLIDRGALRTRIEDLGIPVHTAHIRPGVPSLLGFWRLVRFMRRLKPDLVLGWMYHSCLAAQLANFFLPGRTRVLWSIHYSIDSLASEKKLTAAVIRACALLSRLASQIIFVSHASQAQHQPLGYSLGRSCVIPNGINTSEFVPSGEARSSLRSELGLATDALLVGMMGRYHPIKDYSNFLQAAALTSKKWPNANFVLVGQGVDDWNNELRRSIGELGLASKTHLLGERHDIPRIAAALDVFSLSSYSESFPNVIGEAMACEVSCAVTDVGDAAWIVGDTGRVVPARNPQALAEAWSEIISLGAAGRMALGRAARSRVIERFKLESVVPRYEAVFTAILGPEASDNAMTLPGQSGIPNLIATFDNTAAQ